MASNTRSADAPKPTQLEAMTAKIEKSQPKAPSAAKKKKKSFTKTRDSRISKRVAKAEKSKSSKDDEAGEKEKEVDTHLTKQSTPKKFARKRVDPPQTAGNGPPASKRAKTTSSKKGTVKDEDDNDDDEEKKQATITKDGDVKKASPKSEENDNDEGDSIQINRAPVLHLWSASVTQFTHPDLSWSTCLSCGSAVSSLCAISKGRSIGTVPEADPSKKDAKSEKEADDDDDLEDVEVMQFHLKLKDGKALVSGKPSSDVEETLSKKFKGRYDDIKKVFEEALESWKGDEDGLNKEAFGMYETFRPTVPAGQKGWGRAASLNFGAIRSAVTKDG